MATQTVYKVDNIQGNKINIVAKETGAKLAIEYSKIQRKNSAEKVSLADIQVSDHIIIHKNGNQYVKFELEKQNQPRQTTMNSSGILPSNLHTSPPRPLSMSVPDQFVEPLVSPAVETSVANLTEDYYLKISLASFFGGVRKIRSGNTNFPMAFMTGLLDFCLILNRKVVFDELKSILYQYDHMKIHQTQALTEFDQFFSSPEPQKILMEQVRQFYIRKAAELENTLRNLVYITVKLDYYRHGSYEYKSQRKESEHYNVFYSGLLEPADVLFLLERIDMKLKIFEMSRSCVTSYGSSSSNCFHLIQLESRDYFNGFNKQLWFLRTAESQEKSEAIVFLDSLNQQRSSLRNTNKERVSSEIKELDEKSAEIMRVIQEINTKLGFELDSVTIENYIKEQDLLSTFRQFCCGSCQKFRKVYELPCSHLICLYCYQQINAQENYPNSIKCRNCFCLEYSSKVSYYFDS